MKVRIDVGRRDIVEPFTAVEVIDWRPTTRSLDWSGAKLKGTLFGTSRERS